MTLYKKTDTVIPNIKLMAINMDGTLMDSSDHIMEHRFGGCTPSHPYTRQSFRAGPYKLSWNS